MAPGHCNTHDSRGPCEPPLPDGSQTALGSGQEPGRLSPADPLVFCQSPVSKSELIKSFLGFLKITVVGVVTAF